MKESRVTIFGLFLTLAALVIALLNWLAPFSSVGPSPFGRFVDTNSIDDNRGNNENIEQQTTVSITVESVGEIDASLVSTPLPTLMPIQSWTNETQYSIAQGWDLLIEELGETGFEDGKFFVSNKKENTLYISLWKGVGGNISNAVFSVDLIRPGIATAPYGAGVVFGWLPNSLGNTYAYLVRKDGTCSFHEESYESWTTVSEGNTNSFLTQKEVHTVTVVVNNGHAYGFVDGVYCDDYKLTAYEPGYIGVAARRGASQIEKTLAYFDNARLFILPQTTTNE